EQPDHFQHRSGALRDAHHHPRSAREGARREPRVASRGEGGAALKGGGRAVRVYIAAPKADLGRAQRCAKWLRERGIEVVSRWQDILEEDAEDPTSYTERSKILEDNDADLARADHVLALLSPEGRESFIEV